MIFIIMLFLWSNKYFILQYNLIYFNMKTSIKVLHWTPRILCILAILFVSLFALDSFSSELTFWQNIAALMMHLIPSFILLAVLIIAWKWEKVGGITLTIFGLAFWIFIFIVNLNRTHSVVTSLMISLILCIPFVLAGILFIRSHFRKKEEISEV
jgi:hypothetical protein